MSHDGESINPGFRFQCVPAFLNFIFWPQFCSSPPNVHRTVIMPRLSARRRERERCEAAAWFTHEGLVPRVVYIVTCSWKEKRSLAPEENRHWQSSTYIPLHSLQVAVVGCKCTVYCSCEQQVRIVRNMRPRGRTVSPFFSNSTSFCGP